MPCSVRSRIVRTASDGWSHQRCSSSVIAPGWGNLGARPNPPFSGSNTRVMPVTALAEHVERRLARRRLVQVVAHDTAHGLRLRLHLAAAGAVRVEHALEHGPEAGASVRAVGREVGAAVEHLAHRREKRGQGPATLPGERLHRALVARVDVGPLVAVHLDADEVLVQELRQRRILVRLAVHDVAPVAPDRADVEQHRTILRPGGGEGLVAPGEPVNGLVRGRLEVGGAGGGEAIRAHRMKVAKRAHLRAPFSSPSAPGSVRSGALVAQRVDVGRDRLDLVVGDAWSRPWAAS